MGVVNVSIATRLDNYSMFNFSFATSEDDEQKEEAPSPTPPPKDFREWLERQGLSEWPLNDDPNNESAQLRHKTDQLSLRPTTILGELEDIRRDLYEHAGLKLRCRQVEIILPCN